MRSSHGAPVRRVEDARQGVADQDSLRTAVDGEAAAFNGGDDFGGLRGCWWGPAVWGGWSGRLMMGSS
jgi:hypothetical protein